MKHSLNPILGSSLICLSLVTCRAPVGSNSVVKETVGGNNGDLNARDKQLMPFTKEQSGGQSTFKYCIETGSDLSEDDIQLFRQAVSSAFSAWTSYIDEARVNDMLVAGGGYAIPGKFSLDENCANSSLKFYFGSQVSDKDLAAQLASRSRDSAITAIFDGKSLISDKSTIVWINGMSKPPLPGDMSRIEVPKIDFADAYELKAVTRYIVGRLFGNGITPSGILARKPEDLLNCYRKGDASCVAIVKSEKIANSESQLVTTDSQEQSQFNGCVSAQGSSGRWTRLPAQLIVSKDGTMQILPTDVTDAKLPDVTWTAEPERSNGLKVEVFAQNSPARLYYEEFGFDGYLKDSAGKPQTASLKANQNGSAIDLVRISAPAINYLFTSRATVCRR